MKAVLITVVLLMVAVEIRSSNAYPLKVCNERELQQNCKPLLAGYDKNDEHGSWMSVSYTLCGGQEIKNQRIEKNGFMKCIQPSTSVKIGPYDTRTNYKVLPINNGFYISCHGTVGSGGAGCEIKIEYPECSKDPACSKLLSSH